jgi:hypothetical protein
LGRKAKWGYFRVIYRPYCRADRKTKREMLNEFCLTTRYHRKYAKRELSRPSTRSKAAWTVCDIGKDEDPFEEKVAALLGNPIPDPDSGEKT